MVESWLFEIWRSIKDHPMYCVSNAGRVISYKDPHLGIFSRDENPLRVRHDGEPTLLKPKEHRLGYFYVYLTEPGQKLEKHYIHRLVADAFIPNPQNKPEVNHINGDKKCNYVFNLEWCTHKENMEHARRTGLINSDTYRRMAEANMTPVYCYELDKLFPSMDDASSELGLFKSQICLCCQGKAMNAGGYHFCYLKDVAEFKEYINEIKAREHGHRRVRAIRVDTGEEIIFSSRKEASNALNIPDSYISNIIAGRNYQTRGWTFVDDTPKKFKEES